MPNFDQTYRALTLTQPWASAIACQLKSWETRSWPTAYRGDLFIHAARGFPASARMFASTERTLGRGLARVPLGAIVCVCRVAACHPVEEIAPIVGAIERLYGDYSPGRFAWHLTDLRFLREPVPARGRLGLWIPDAALVERVKSVMIIRDPCEEEPNA